MIACGPPPVVEVSLTTASFATTGGNLFNCSTPAFAATAQALDKSTIGCSPTRNSDGTYSTTPVTVTTQVYCSKWQWRSRHRHLRGYRR